MNGKGRGSMSIRKINKILRDNGWRLVRKTPHYIYKKDGEELEIAIPRSCHNDIIRRLFKKHGIVERRNKE